MQANESTLRYTVTQIIGTPGMATYMRHAVDSRNLPLDQAQQVRDALQRDSIRRGLSMTVTRFALDNANG